MRKNDGSNYREIYQQLDTLIREHYGDPDYTLPTETSLSQKYGVSRNTVRRAFTELEKESRIRRIRGRGTLINHHATQQTSSSAPRVGVILPEFNPRRPYMMQMAYAAMEAVPRWGGQVELTPMTRGHDRDLQAFRRIKQNPPHGILYFPHRAREATAHTEELKTLIENLDTPTVFLDHGFLLPGGGFFHTHLAASDAFYAIREAVERLISAGHRHIAYLTSPDMQANQVLEERQQGYTDAMVSAGLNPTLLHPEPKKKEAAESIMDDIQRRVQERDLTAIVCSHGHLAAWLAEECRYRKLKMPEELTIVSASLIYRQYSPAPIAIIDPRPEKIGDAAAHLLSRLIKQGSSGNRETLRISGELTNPEAIHQLRGS